MVKRATVAGIALVGLICSTACSSSPRTTVAASSSPPSSTASPSAAGPTVTPGAQKITVTPHVHLRNGQKLHIIASGFTPNSSLIAVECADKGQQTSDGDCNLDSSIYVTADGGGRVVTDLHVVVGPFGSNRITCSAKTKCLVSVSQATFTPTEEASLDISFG